MKSTQQEFRLQHEMGAEVAGYILNAIVRGDKA
jgi:Na+-transporting methylmalonyl-CoA/oxaloacetate decarboxylase beta subunit